MKAKILFSVQFVVLLTFIFLVSTTSVTVNSAPIEFPPIAKPLLDPESIIYKLDDEMVALSSYIRERRPSTSTELSRVMAYEVVTQSKENMIPVELIVGIIETESMWNPECKSGMGAIGLMQILREDGIEIDKKKAFDVPYNIEKGIAIFKSKLRKSGGNLSLALKYYVGGDEEYQKRVYKYMGKFMLLRTKNEGRENV